MKKYEAPQITGWMGGEDLRWLFETAKSMQTIVEVGCWFGKSTHALLSGCPGTVYAVDHFKGSPSEIDVAHKFAKTGDVKAVFLENCGHFKNIMVREGDSVEVSKGFRSKEIDMVFIDGDHDYDPFKADVTAWLPKAKKIICGHDSGYPGIIKALADLGLKPTEATGDIWEVTI